MKDSSSIRRKNTNTVMKALNQIAAPITLTKLIKFIAITYNVDENLIKSPIRRVLQDGVRQGFIAQKEVEYFTYSTEVNVEQSDKQTMVQAKELGVTETSDQNFVNYKNINQVKNKTISRKQEKHK